MPHLAFSGGGSGESSTTTNLSFQWVKNIDDVEKAIAAAKGKPVMLDFYADWCTSCKELEHNTFANPKVKKMLSDFVLLQADVTNNRDHDNALLKKYGLFGPPGILFFNAQGQEIKNARLVGYVEPKRFIDHLKNVFN